MKLQYNNITSKFYGLLDILYFNKKEASPRHGILEFIPDKKLKVLEICIGTAENSIIIARNRTNAEIVGIDLSKDMLAIAEEKIKSQDIHNIKTLIMDATNMNFDDNKFDIVLISLVLHEVDDSIRTEIMKEAIRVLNREGRLIIVEWDKPKRFTQNLLFLIIKLSEPKGFIEFLNSDIKEYVKKFSLKVLNERKCDYTRIIEVAKE